MTRSDSVSDSPLMTVAHDHVRVAVHDLGGDGEPALFAHAAGFHGRIWDPIAAGLGDRLHSHGMDLRGHGDSGPCRSPVDWTLFGQDALAAARSLGGPVVGIGHSLGGAALLMAEMAAPGTFSSLVLYEPAVSDPDLADSRIQGTYAAAARRRRATFGSHHDALTNFAAKPPTNVLAADVLQAYVSHGFRSGDAGGQITIKCDPATEADIYQANGPRQVWTLLHPVGCPVTLIRGEHSEVWDATAANMTAERIGAVLEVFPGAGHFGPLASPEIFTRLLRRVLDRR